MHIQIVLFDGFDPLDVIAPYEVLYAGGSVSDGAVTVELVTAQGPREVVSGTAGLALRAVGALDLDRADMLVVPGASGRVGEPGEVPDHEFGAGEWQPDEFIPVLLGRTLTTELPELLAQAMKAPHMTVATVCGGSLILAMAGLLEGRHVTTHHLGLDMLDATGTHVVRARIVDDGDLITAAGVTSGLDLGLYLLEREVGPRVAHAVEELFAHERRGTVWRAHGLAPTPF
ncbi:DJ-1/PfpI family protein [Nocardia cyriacigeorgica]|uniref:DJ-1/PfpI family protein n=1 Tax=Nocardia cyriacigeorgica TaxID=135487 RepID=UPI001894B915|nr:DJ-1/PfpI family protein [Nocardia cyriacigeorgica]MBF6346290.1 DJ-1/PfpI family protein [Nocardia cyriacigeorgica]MBF6518137.1 DJ-1/PfpI family protein [Nocardia cyriacigeorgica]